MADGSRIVAAVPMKALAESKTRLSGHLCPARRAELSLSMLSWVLSALRESRVSRVVVIGGDERVREGIGGRGGGLDGG